MKEIGAKQKNEKNLKEMWDSNVFFWQGTQKTILWTFLPVAILCWTIL